MNMHRRDFVGGLSIFAAAMLLGRKASGQDGSTWLNYAVDLETFRSKTPLLERLKLLSDTGFKSYEFGRFKTKDYLALNKTGRELSLSPVRFTVDTGIVSPGRKQSFLDSLGDALEVAELLEVKRLVVGAGELSAKLGADRQIEAMLNALEAGVELIKDTEVTLLLDPLVRKGSPKQRAAGDIKTAAGFIDELNTTKVRVLIDLESGWSLDKSFLEQVKEHAKTIGTFRLNADRLKEGTRTAGLEPLDLLKLIHEVNAAESLGIEFSLKGNPVEALNRIAKLDAQAKG